MSDDPSASSEVEHEGARAIPGRVHGRFRTTFETAGIGMCLTAPDGAFLQVNPALCEMLGFTEEELASRDFASVTHPDDLAVSRECVRCLLAGERSIYRFEKRYLHKDGGVVWADVSTALVHDETGEPAYFITQIQDVTDRKDAESQLRQTQRLLSSLIEHAPTPIYANELDSSYRFVNPAWERLARIRQEDAVGRTVAELFEPEVAKAFEEGVRPVVETGGPVSVDESGVVSDRRYHYRSVRFGILNDEGEVEAVGTISIDITDRKRAEAALRDSEERFRTAFERAAIGMTLTGPDGRFIEANEAFCRMVGYSREELPSVSFLELTHPDDVEVSREVTRRLLSGESEAEYLEKRYVRRDGEAVWAEVSVFLLRDADGAPLHFITHQRDITGRRRTQAALRESEERYRGLYESLPGGVMVVDRAEAIVQANPTAREILGLPGVELVPLTPFAPIWETIHEDGTAFSRETHPVSVTLRTGQSVRNVVMGLYSHSGENTRWILVNSEPLQDPHTGEVEAAIANFVDVTDWRRTAAALRENEFLLRESQRVAAIGSYRADFTADRWESSDVLDRVFGIDESYVRSVAGWLDIVHPDDREMMDRYLSGEVSAGRRAFDKEYRIVRQSDGDVRWVHGLGEASFDAGGNLSSLIGTIQDITARKHAEADLRETLSELRRFVAVVTASPVVFFTSREGDPGGIEFISENIEQFGYSADDFTTGRITWTGIMHPDDERRVGTETDGYLTRGLREFTVAYRVTTATGDVRWVEESTIVSVDAEGVITGYAGLLVDVTDRKRAELVLRESEHRFREMTDLLPDMVFEVDQDLHFTYINRAVGEVLGYAPSDLRADSVLADVMDEETLTRAVEDLAIAVAAGRSLVGVYDLRRRDGTRIPAEFHAMRVLGPDGELVGYRGAVRDITDRRRAEDAQRMAAVGQLAAGVGHEFNNLLAGLMLQAELTAADRTIERCDDLVRTALAVATRGRDVCRNLTTFVRPEAPRREPLYIEATIETALALLAHQIENAEVAVTRDYQADGQRVYADGGQLGQIFVNLFVNACHAMPQGGKLTIETRHLPQVGGSGDIVVRVSDTGTGIGHEDLPRIFEPFFTTKGRLGDSDIPGSGLGLSVSHGIIEAHGGEIRARSEVGAGTTLELVLPAYTSAAPTEPLAPMDEPMLEATPTHRTARILLAEDNLTVIEIVEAFLTGSGHEVDCVHTTQEAVAAMQASRYDLVITDLLMPGGGGRGVIEFVRSTEKPPPVLVITGATQEKAEDALAAGASRVIHKPFTHADLTQAIEESLAGDAG